MCPLLQSNWNHWPGCWEDYATTSTTGCCWCCEWGRLSKLVQSLKTCHSPTKQKNAPMASTCVSLHAFVCVCEERRRGSATLNVLGGGDSGKPGGQHSNATGGIKTQAHPANGLTPALPDGGAWQQSWSASSDYSESSTSTKCPQLVPLCWTFVSHCGRSSTMSWCLAGFPRGQHHLGVPTPPQLSLRLHPEPLPAHQWDPQRLDPLPAHLVLLTPSLW